MILSDGTISQLIAAERLTISPLVRAHIQPSSVDLCLGFSFRVFETHRHDLIDPFEKQDLTREVEAKDDFVLHPGEFVLASTAETVGLPDNIVARVDGKSSLGRLGLLIHATAGFVDPGFRGQITLELSNVAPMPIRLSPGMKIAQISFWTLDQPAQRPYGHPELGSKYQDQTGATASEYARNR